MHINCEQEEQGHQFKNVKKGSFWFHIVFKHVCCV